MSYTERLNIQSRKQQDVRQMARAAELKAQIRASSETITAFGQVMQCISLDGIFRDEWGFIGSGLVALHPASGSVLIERQ